MSLVAGRGPLSSDPAGRFTPPIPADVVYIEPHPRRVQAVLNGRTVIDTEKALMVHRRNHPLSYAFPAEAITDLPAEPEPQAPGFVRVPWDVVDTWFEEGRKLVHYPPNPYHRVDCRPTRRRLTVSVNDTLLVDTDDTVIVFETALEPRLYVNPKHVRIDLLQQSESSTYCNYKGFATYWSANLTGTPVPDMALKVIAWSYQNPLPESQPIKGLFSFDATQADVTAELPEP
jgi:uncharacterized protein (DUF427 family)